MLSPQIFKAKKQVISFFHLYVISKFSLFLFLSVLSVELNFIIIAVFLAKLANLSCSIMAYVFMVSYFWKNLRSGQCSNSDPLKLEGLIAYKSDVAGLLKT